MEQGKRPRGNSIAATPGPPNNDGGSIAKTQVDESRTQESRDISHESQDYELEMKDCSPPSNPAPRRPYTRIPTSTPTPENAVKPTSREQCTTRPLLEPPVTKGTLSELDVNKIVHNPKLRHDINFDPELHFRPNLDGEKGRKKTQKANDFWDTMRLQLRGYLADRDQFEAEIGDLEWCLPATLKAIRGILETLVPQRDRSSVEETFNVDLLMQQFRKGVADLEKLALWLSQLLKCHCAPMRDDWVDQMVTQLSNGDRNWDVEQLVLGMRNLLGVLEAMKLDVANHQIRCLRPLLIDDTVHFEQKFFMRKIAMGRVDLAGAHNWYKKAASLPNVTPLDASNHSQSNTWDFMRLLVNLTLPSKHAESVPHTFLFDEERLLKLRQDMQDLINLEICMYLYGKLEATSRISEARSTTQDSTPITSFISSPADNGVLSEATLPSEQDFHPKRKHNHFAQEKGHFTRTASGRQVWVPYLEDEAMESNSSTPRSCPSSTSSTPETNMQTPMYLLQYSDSATQVRSSLQAILASSTASDRWISLAPNIALQILRSTPTPLTRLPQFESHLGFHLTNPRSKLYLEAEVRVLSLLLPVLQKLVENYTPLTSLQIFEAATAPKPVPGNVVGSSTTSGVKEEIAEIATRIAHIGILHWRVWAPLAYLVNPEEDEDVAMRLEVDSGNSSELR